ncbi:MAG: beta-lactamase family protein [Acidobacteria bacterium]|nr:beta-lactamase family protein [Acidobacteriota bacterium]
MPNRKLKGILYKTAVINIVIFLLFVMMPASKLETATKYRETIEFMQELVDDQMDDEDIIGMSVALVDEDKVVWSGGFGYADEKRKKRMTVDTAFHIGSMSELFVSHAVFKLAEEGKIDINKPVSFYLPEFSINSHEKYETEITVKDLITHHSGLPSELRGGSINTKPIKQNDYIKMLSSEYMCSKPHYVFAFSYIDIEILTKIVEKISGKPFDTYIRENFLDPLGMKHTGFGLNTEVKNFMTKPYRDEDERPQLYVRDRYSMGMYSSAADMTEYLKMFLKSSKNNNSKIFTNEQAEKTMTALNTDTPLDYSLRMGYGWVLTNIGDYFKYVGKYAWHDSVALGNTGRVIILPEHGLGIVVFSNTSGNQSSQVVALEGIKKALAEKKKLIQPEWPEPELRETKTDAELKRIAGEYATSAGLVKIEQDGRDLRAEAMGRTLELQENVNGNFSGRVVLLGFIKLKVGPLSNIEFAFDQIDGEQVVALYQYGDGFLIGTKVKKEDINVAWYMRFGKYRIRKSSDYSHYDEMLLTIENNALTVKLYRDDNDDPVAILPLRTISANEAVVIGLGRNMGDTIRFSDNPGERIRYSGYEFYRVKQGK